MGWRFAQLSDAHLGAKLAGFPQKLADDLREGQRRAVAEALRIAQDEGCRAVLIPGDLFDLRGNDPEGSLYYFYTLARKHFAMQFFVCPGNADAYGPSSPYALNRPAENVHVFTSPVWQTFELDGVAITSRGMQMGEGQSKMDWSLVPPPPSGHLSILMLHASVNGLDDGRSQRLPLTPVAPNEVLGCGYTYTALGHLHIKAELQIKEGIAGAAYSGPPSCMDSEERGPGGVLIGDLTEEGARLKFVSTAQYVFRQKTVVLPAESQENYRSLLDTSFRELLSGLKKTDILRLKVSGDLHQSRQHELEQVVARAAENVAHCESQDIRVHYTSGIDPLSVPEDSLLGRFMRSAAAEGTSGRADPEVIALIRRFGWCLFNGQGLPMEITE